MLSEQIHKPLAKMGYAARGVIYLTIGGLALLSALGLGGEKTDSKGAILSLRGQPFGELLLALLLAGLVGYVIWRAIQGLADADDHGYSVKGLAIRGGLLVSAITHGVLGYWVAKLLLHENDSSSDQSVASMLTEYLGQETTSAVFIVAGVSVLVVGLAHLYKGYKSGFNKHLDIPEAKKRWLTPVCQFGLIARGVMWLIVGWIILQSTIAAGANDSEGLEEAFQWLSDTPYGTALIGLIGVGLVAFGFYSCVEAVYRRVDK